MSKYTVWMAGDGRFDSWNTKPRKFDDIEADTFISACRYVWDYYHNGESGHWVLDLDGETPLLRHTYRDWCYGLYPTEEDAYDATFGKIEAQKVAIYRKLHNLKDTESVCLKCWEKFAIPYLEADGENINITYACYPLNKFIMCYTPNDELLSWREFIDAQTGYCLTVMSECVNCPKHNAFES